MRYLLSILAWVLVSGLAQAQPVSPLELVRPEDAARVMKYYEAQFGAERRDEMIRRAATNQNLSVLLETLDVELKRLSRMAIREKMSSDVNGLLSKKAEQRPLEWKIYVRDNHDSIETAVRLFFAYAGEDYHAALPAIIAKRKSQTPDVTSRTNNDVTITAVEKQMVLEGSRRGGVSTGYVHASWMLDGVEVVKNETKGWGQFAKCAEYSPLATEEYASALMKKGSPESYALSGPLYRKIVSQYPNYYRSDVSHYHARLTAEELGEHVDYLTTGYVELARFGRNGENRGLISYEREHGGKSSTWWPWSKPNRIAAQERAAEIISSIKGLENPKLDRGTRSFSEADEASKALVRLVDKAHDGDSISMYDLGIAYLNGLNGFPKNPEAAREWFRLSSARGFVPASYNLGICLTEGVGGPADASEAARLFRIGAMRSDPLSQSNFGASYGMGRGVARNYVEAAAWWLLCESKVPQAKANLASLVASSEPGFMAKAQARSKVLQDEIMFQFLALKKDLVW